MLRVLIASIGPFVNGLQPYDTHQTTHAMTASLEPVSGQVGCYLAATKEWVFRENTIYLVHQFCFAAFTPTGV